MSTVLYRLIGPGDCLLYVGITSDFTERLRRHRSTSVFGHLIVATEQEILDDRSDAAEAERVAIATESPLFNTIHSGDAVPLLLDGVGPLVYEMARSSRVSLRDLAQVAGMSERRLLRVLADPNAPSLGELTRLAKALGTTAGSIITDWERRAA